MSFLWKKNCLNVNMFIYIDTIFFPGSYINLNFKPSPTLVASTVSKQHGCKVCCIKNSCRKKLIDNLKIF